MSLPARISGHQTTAFSKPLATSLCAWEERTAHCVLFFLDEQWCVCTRAQTWMEDRGPCQCFPLSFSTFIFDPGTHPCTQAQWSANPHDCSISAFQCQTHAATPDFYMKAGSLNSGSHLMLPEEVLYPLSHPALAHTRTHTHTHTHTHTCVCV